MYYLISRENHVTGEHWVKVQTTAPLTSGGMELPAHIGWLETWGDTVRRAHGEFEDLHDARERVYDNWPAAEEQEPEDLYGEEDEALPWWLISGGNRE